MLINSKLKKASSLIEVIVVLAIVSFTIIAAMSLVAKTRLEIKNNEIEDNANGVLLKAIEALKTPSKSVIYGTPSLTGVDVAYYFSLSKQGDNFVLNYLGTTGFKPLPRTSGSFNFSEECPDNSEPFFGTDGGTFKYCQQVIITPQSPITRSAGAPLMYKIDTTIIYQISSQSKSETLTTYRYDGFTKIAKQTP